MLLYVVYEEEGILDTSGIGSSETALQCNFELIPVQIEALASYVPGSSVALIVISLIVSGSVASTLRWFIRLINRITQSIQQLAGPL